MAAIESYALLVRPVPTVFLFGLAWAVARSPYQSMANRLLVTLFSLLGLGFLLELLVDLTMPLSAQLAHLLQALVLTIGVVDPPVLLAFSLAFPDPRPALRSPTLWAASGAVALLVLYLALTAGRAGAWAMTVYVDAMYLTSFGLLLRAYVRERHRFRERQLFFVVLGVGFAAVSRSAAVLFSHPVRTPLGPALTFLLTGLGITLLLTGLFYAWARRLPAPARTRVLFRWLLAALLGFLAVHSLVLSLNELGLRVSGQYFGLRWVVVGGILGYGILRYQLFDFELRARQAVIFLASLFVGSLTAFATALLVGDGSMGLTATRAVGLGVGVGATLLCYTLLTRLWRLAWPGTELPVRFRRRRIELYEAALEYALADTRWTLGDHLFAVTLREVFQITPEEHEQVVRRLSDPAPGPS